MSEIAEGIGGRKWSLGRELVSGQLAVMQGKSHMATLTDSATEPCGKHVAHLIVTAPQLWAAANAICLQWNENRLFHTPEMLALCNMVAKAVGKSDFRNVKQS